MGSDSEARARGAQRKGGEAGREWEGRRGRLEREGGVGGGGGFGLVRQEIDYPCNRDTVNSALCPEGMVAQVQNSSTV